MALRTLYDSPVLEPIARAAERVGLEAFLLGGTASRAMLFDAAGVPAQDLFELAEHAAVIEIGHSGSADRTPDLAAAIAATVPLSPWFRWSIMDEACLAAIESGRSGRFEVPLRQLRLGMHRPRSSSGTVRLLRRALRGRIDLGSPELDASYPTTPLSLASAVLVYVDAAFDVIQADLRRRPPTWSGPGQSAPSANMVRAAVSRFDELDRFERMSSLRRLWYRFASSALRLSEDLLQSAVEHFGLGPLVALLDESGYPAFRLVAGDGVPIIAAYSDDEVFRTPLMMDDEPDSVDWPSAFKQTLADVDASSYGRGFYDPITLAPGNLVVGGLRAIPIGRGLGPSSRSAIGLPQEFLHLALRMTNASILVDPRDLTAVVLGHGRDGSSLLAGVGSASVPMKRPRDGYVSRPAQRCTVRVNLLELHDDVDVIDVFLVRRDAR